MMDSLLKMMDFLLKMMNFVQFWCECLYTQCIWKPQQIQITPLDLSCEYQLSTAILYRNGRFFKRKLRVSLSKRPLFQTKTANFSRNGRFFKRKQYWKVAISIGWLRHGRVQANSDSDAKFMLLPLDNHAIARRVSLSLQPYQSCCLRRYPILHSF